MMTWIAACVKSKGNWMQLSPQTIEALGLIAPFSHKHIHAHTGMSGGLSCAGYDVHMGAQVVEAFDTDGSPLFNAKPWFTGENGALYPVNAPTTPCWVLPPRTGCLAVTHERFKIPPDVAMAYFNKSTLARRFLNACATLGEPGWEGHLTLEIYNQSDRYQYLIPGQPIGQVVFHRLDEESAFPYAGKYQGQGAVPVQAKREGE